MALYNYMISAGSSGSGALVNVENLSTPVDPPKGLFHPYSQMLQLGDGTVRGGGWATATWSWKIITVAQRDQLRTFCPGASAVVYIQTRTMDSTDSYGIYQAVMVWPITTEDRDIGQYRPRPDFEIKFQRLTQ
jgi:hypothetical protein